MYNKKTKQMSLPKLSTKTKSPTRHRYISSKQKQDWTCYLFKPQQTIPNAEQLNFYTSPFPRKFFRQLPKIRTTKTQIDKQIVQKIQRYQKTYFSPSNCAKSLKLGAVFRDRMVRPIQTELFKSAIKPRKRKQILVKSIGLEEFIYDGNWKNT